MGEEDEAGERDGERMGLGLGRVIGMQRAMGVGRDEEGEGSRIGGNGMKQGRVVGMGEGVNLGERDRIEGGE